MQLASSKQSKFLVLQARLRVWHYKAFPEQLHICISCTDMQSVSCGLTKPSKANNPNPPLSLLSLCILHSACADNGPKFGKFPNHVSSNYGNDSAQTWKQDREMAVDKKLAKKLAKMSEEDRAIFLEQQRLAEEENQRKKEEMLSRFLKVGGVCQNQSLT